MRHLHNCIWGFKRNSRGGSLLETMIGVGILGIVIMATGSLSTTISSSAHNVTVSNNFTSLLNKLRQITVSSSQCAVAFTLNGGANPNPATLDPADPSWQSAAWVGAAAGTGKQVPMQVPNLFGGAAMNSNQLNGEAVAGDGTGTLLPVLGLYTQKLIIRDAMPTCGVGTLPACPTAGTSNWMGKLMLQTSRIDANQVGGEARPVAMVSGLSFTITANPLVGPPNQITACSGGPAVSTSDICNAIGCPVNTANGGVPPCLCPSFDQGCPNPGEYPVGIDANGILICQTFGGVPCPPGTALVGLGINASYCATLPDMGCPAPASFQWSGNGPNFTAGGGGPQCQAPGQPLTNGQQIHVFAGAPATGDAYFHCTNGTVTASTPDLTTSATPAPSNPTCTSNCTMPTTITWTAGGNTCTADATSPFGHVPGVDVTSWASGTPSAPDIQPTVASQYTGSAWWDCNLGVMTLKAASTCSPPPGCVVTTATWNVGGNICTANFAAGNTFPNGPSTLTANTGLNTGTAVYTCVGGVWTNPGPNSCNAPAAGTCTVASGTPWVDATTGKTCTVGTASAPYNVGTNTVVTNAAGATNVGSATFSCPAQNTPTFVSGTCNGPGGALGLCQLPDPTSTLVTWDAANPGGWAYTDMKTCFQQYTSSMVWGNSGGSGDSNMQPTWSDGDNTLWPTDVMWTPIAGTTCDQDTDPGWGATLLAAMRPANPKGWPGAGCWRCHNHMCYNRNKWCSNGEIYHFFTYYGNNGNWLHGGGCYHGYCWGPRSCPEEFHINYDTATGVTQTTAMPAACDDVAGPGKHLLHCPAFAFQVPAAGEFCISLGFMGGFCIPEPNCDGTNSMALGVGVGNDALCSAGAAWDTFGGTKCFSQSATFVSCAAGNAKANCTCN